MPDLPLITSEDFDALEPEWAALHARVPGASPFLHPEWHRVWLRNFGERSRTGLPLRPQGRGTRRRRRLRYGPRSGPRTRRPQRPRLRRARSPSPARNSRLPPGSSNGSAKTSRPARTSGVCRLTRRCSPQSPKRPPRAAGRSISNTKPSVPASTSPATSRSSSLPFPRRTATNSAAKCATSRPPARPHSDSVTAPEDIASALPGLFHLMRISRGDKDEFLTPQMEAFFHDLGRTFGALGMVRLSTLSLDDAPVAMTLAFEDGATTYLYNSGYDPAYSHLAVGLVSKAHAIRDGIERGAHALRLPSRRRGLQAPPRRHRPRGRLSPVQHDCLICPRAYWARSLLRFLLRLPQPAGRLSVIQERPDALRPVPHDMAADVDQSLAQPVAAHRHLQVQALRREPCRHMVVVDRTFHASNHTGSRR